MMMSVPPVPVQPSTQRVSLFYKIGLVVVLIFDAALALPFAYFRSHGPAALTRIDVISETIGYAGCSIACPIICVIGIAILIARAGNRPLGPTVVKALFWSGLTVVPLFLAFMALSYFANHR